MMYGMGESLCLTFTKIKKGKKKKYKIRFAKVLRSTLLLSLSQ